MTAGFRPSLSEMELRDRSLPAERIGDGGWLQGFVADPPAKAGPTRAEAHGKREKSQEPVRRK